MANVQLLDLRDGTHRTDILRAEAVSGEHPQAQAAGQSRGIAKTANLQRGIGVHRQLAVGACVEFDGIGFELGRHLDLVEDRIHEEADPDSRGAKLANHGLQHALQKDGVEPTLGGELLAALGDQGYPGGLHRKHRLQGFGGRRALHVQGHGQHFLQEAQVPLLDVAAVAPEVHCDAMGPSTLG